MGYVNITLGCLYVTLVALYLEQDNIWIASIWAFAAIMQFAAGIVYLKINGR